MRIIFVAHSGDMDYQGVLYTPLRESELNSKYKIVLPHETEDIFNSHEIIKESGIIIAEISNRSTGVGIELGWAHALGKHIICISLDGVPVHDYMKYLTDTFITYSDSADLIKKLETKLLFKWSDVMDDDLFKDGVLIQIRAESKADLQAFVEKLSYEAGAFCDWHFAGGRGCIQTMKENVPRVIQALERIE